MIKNGIFSHFSHFLSFFKNAKKHVKKTCTQKIAVFGKDLCLEAPFSRYQGQFAQLPCLVLLARFRRERENGGTSKRTGVPWRFWGSRTPSPRTPGLGGPGPRIPDLGSLDPGSQIQGPSAPVQDFALLACSVLIIPMLLGWALLKVDIDDCQA